MSIGNNIISLRWLWVVPTGISFIKGLCWASSYRYRISGSALLAAMDQSSLVSSANMTPQQVDNEETESTQTDGNMENKNEDKFSRLDERNTRGQPTVDIAEVLRRWTHALQRIHKQSLQLVRSSMWNEFLSVFYFCFRCFGCILRCNM